MQKKLILLFVLAGFWVSSSAMAEEMTMRRYDVGFGLGGVIPDNAELNAGFAMNGNFAWHATPYVAVGFDVGFVQSKDKWLGYNFGDLKGVPLFADVLLTLPLPQYHLEPYLVTGFGTVIWDYDESSDIRRDLSEAGIQMDRLDIDNSFAFKLGGGLDWMIGNNWIMNFELAYVFNNSDATLRTAGGSYRADEMNLDYWTLMGGLKYTFG